MTSQLLRDLAKVHVRKVPDIRPGYTVRVHEKIQEGEKERVQIFEGLVISVHKGHLPTDSSILVRRIASGVGVEKLFALMSPTVEKIEVKKVAKVRRAKLFFLRGRAGKSARLSERFTSSEEFGMAVAPDVKQETAEGVVESESKETDETQETKEPKAEKKEKK